MNSGEREREARTHTPVRAVRTHQAPVRAIRTHQRRRSRSEITISPSRRSRSAQCFASSSSTTAPSITISRSIASLRKIAIDGAISRSVDRDLAKARSQSRIAIDGTGASERRGLELGACERRGLVRACLSLSLSLRNSFEVKIGTKIYFRSQSLFFSVNGNQFSKNFIFRTNQIPTFPKKYFQK